MDLLVQTGSTKGTTNVSLVSETFKSVGGETVNMIIQVHASKEDAKMLEKEWSAILEHSLLETDGDAASRLDGTLKELNGLLKGLLMSGTVSDVHAIIALAEKNGSLHISHAGQAEAYLVRGGIASQVTEYTRGKPTPAFVHISSGDIKPKDIVVLSSQRLLRTVTPVQLAQMAKREDQLLEELRVSLDAEREQAALGVLLMEGKETEAPLATEEVRRTPSRRSGKRGGSVLSGLSLPAFSLPSLPSLSSVSKFKKSMPKVQMKSVLSGKFIEKSKDAITSFLGDLRDPKRKKRAHLLLIAGTLAAFLIVWSGVQLSTTSQRSKTKAELKELVTEIDGQIRTAENRRLAGDIDSANAILQRAEDQAKQVVDNESGYFKSEALDLIDRIRAKTEEINNIVRLPPRLVVNLSSKNPDVITQGFIGMEDGEFLIYDRQDVYRVILNSVEEPDRIVDEELITKGVSFPRYQTSVFQTTDNSMLEIISDQPTSMKTDDPAGWIMGKDMETYLRYLYVLSPENNQIYKYERLNNRYGAPTGYNVNADLKTALDMTIDGSVYVLKEGGEVLKLLRGETQPFSLRYAPEKVLQDVTKIYKVPDGRNLYFLDPVGHRIIVTTSGGDTGEASYSRQYILESDQIGELKDIYVDTDETHLYVLDEKRVYAIDLEVQ